MPPEPVGGRWLASLLVRRESLGFALTPLLLEGGTHSHAGALRAFPLASTFLPKPSPLTC